MARRGSARAGLFLVRRQTETTKPDRRRKTAASAPLAFGHHPGKSIGRSMREINPSSYRAKSGDNSGECDEWYATRSEGSNKGLLLYRFEKMVIIQYIRQQEWRRGWDSNPRYATRTTVFETAPFDHSGTPPHGRAGLTGRSSAGACRSSTTFARPPAPAPRRLEPGRPGMVQCSTRKTRDRPCSKRPSRRAAHDRATSLTARFRPLYSRGPAKRRCQFAGQSGADDFERVGRNEAQAPCTQS